MEREQKYPDHPMHEPQKKRLKPHYIHGCGRAIRFFSTWAYEESYLDENIMRRLKLRKLPQPFKQATEREPIWALDTSVPIGYYIFRIEPGVISSILIRELSVE